jgi:hypothetical protein
MNSKPAKMPEGYFGWSLINGEAGKVMLTDVLHNLSARENGDNHQQSCGILIGVVSTLMACGMTFEDAMQLIWQCAPSDCHYERFPDSWRDLFNGKIAKNTIPS